MHGGNTGNFEMIDNGQICCHLHHLWAENSSKNKATEQPLNLVRAVELSQTSGKYTKHREHVGVGSVLNLEINAYTIIHLKNQ
jgi:hypothetical protein